jgi:hypothetical protein
MVRSIFCSMMKCMGSQNNLPAARDASVAGVPPRTRNQTALPVSKRCQREAPKSFMSRLSRLQPIPIVRGGHHERSL